MVADLKKSLQNYLVSSLLSMKIWRKSRMVTAGLCVSRAVQRFSDPQKACTCAPAVSTKYQNASLVFCSTELIFRSKCPELIAKS